MTDLRLADETEAADLAAFLSRLLHYDRSAAVRLQAAGTALAVFGRPASFEVLAVRAVRLAEPYRNAPDAVLDVTVSAGELLESVDESAATAVVPAPVTGPPWAGVLPPRGGWRTEPGLPPAGALGATVAAAVAEFRSRTGELAQEHRTRAELDRIGREIWSRLVGETQLPVRALHAAQSLRFLRPPAAMGGEGPAEPPVAVGGEDSARPPAAVGGEDPVKSPAAVGGEDPVKSPAAVGGEDPAKPPAAVGGENFVKSPADFGEEDSAKPPAAVGGEGLALLSSGAWLRLRTPYGSIAVRRADAGLGALGVSVR